MTASRRCRRGDIVANDRETRKLIIEVVKQTVPLVLAQRQPPRLSGYRATEQRLYAYPVLMDNVHNRWPADIEDLKKEKATETSKSIVRWSQQGGVKLTAEERQEARILAVQAKLERDRQELAVMDRALGTIKMDAAYSWLTAFYFEGLDLDTIAEQNGTTRQHVARSKAALVRVLALRLYGAEALDG